MAFAGSKYKAEFSIWCSGGRAGRGSISQGPSRSAGAGDGQGSQQAALGFVGEGGGAEEHEVLVALLDDLAGAGGVGVIGAWLRFEGNHVALLGPGALGMGAAGREGEVGHGGDAVRRGAGGARADVKHVPLLAVVDGPGGACGTRVVLPGVA